MRSPNCHVLYTSPTSLFITGDARAHELCTPVETFREGACIRGRHLTPKWATRERLRRFRLKSHDHLTARARMSEPPN